MTKETGDEHKWREAVYPQETEIAADPHTTRQVCTVCGLNICEFCGAEDPAYRNCVKQVQSV